MLSINQWHGTYPTKKVMHRWLQTHQEMADIGLSTASREVLLKVEKDRVALEGDMRERGDALSCMIMTEGPFTK
jgi:hypothetical protein